jgi:hypothetical protein
MDINNVIKQNTPVKLRYRLDLTTAEETAIMRAYAAELIADKQKGLSFFQEAGILDEDGKPTEHYRRTEQYV